MNKIAVDTFLSYKFVSNPVVSPKGNYVAYFVKDTNIEKNNYNSNIWLYNVATGENKQLTVGDDAISFIWKNCHTVLFAAKRGDMEKGKTKFYEIDVNGGEAAHAFTVDAPVQKIAKIDCENYILTASYDNSVAHREGYPVFDESPFWINNVGVTNKKRTRLYLYNVKTGLSAVTEEMFNVSGFVLCPGKTDVLFSGAEFKDVQQGKQGLYHYNIPNGTLECIIPAGQLYIRGGYEFVKGGIIVPAHDGKKIGGNQSPVLYFIDWETKTMKPILDKDEGFGGESVGCDAKLGGGQGFKVMGDKIYYITTNAEHGYLKGVDLDGNAFDVITTDGAVNSFDMFEDKIYFVALRGNEIAELYTLENGVEKKLSHHNDELWATLSISTPEFLKFTATDGYEIHGYVMKPIGYEEGKKYPAILHIHGGPKTAFGSVFHNEMQVWANAGYFVCYCNPRGSDGRGNDFADIFGKYGTVDYDNLMEFADKCLEMYPDIDKDNFGVGGGSYGGFMTNWIIGHTNRFKAAVTQRSITNWTTFEFTSDIGAHFTKDQHKVCTEENPEALWNMSPLKYLNNAKTPTLVIHSKEDYRCWLVEGVATFQALKLHGCEAKMVIFNGDNHELSRSGQPRNRIKRMEEILAWYDAHLKA